MRDMNHETDESRLYFCFHSFTACFRLLPPYLFDRRLVRADRRDLRGGEVPPPQHLVRAAGDDGRVARPRRAERGRAELRLRLRLELALLRDVVAAQLAVPRGTVAERGGARA